MNKNIIYIAALLLAAIGFTACDDNWERPPLAIPHATMEANTTIAQLKAMYDDGATSSCFQIGTLPSGEDIIVEGRAVSSDQSGNVFKTLYIQDETAAIAIRLDQYDLYQTFQYGQKVVVKATGLYIGCYGGLMQMGWTESNGTPSRIPEDQIGAHFEVDGLAEVAKLKVYDTSIEELNSLLGIPNALDWQCRLVRLSGVSFDDAGKVTFVQDGSSNTSRYLLDAKGNRIILYSSSYANFAKLLLPEGTGSVTAILSYFNRSGWQLILNSTADLEGFGELVEGAGSDSPTPGAITGDGSESKPFTVGDVLLGASGTGVWVKGYIVGWVDGQAFESGVRFNSSASSKTNLLIAETPDCTEAAKCLPVQLPAGDVRNALNLQENPANYKKPVELLGNIDTYFSVPGIKSVTDFKIEGGSAPGAQEQTIYLGLVDNMDGWTIENVAKPEGVADIWTWKEYNGSGYLNGSAYLSSGSADSEAYAYVAVDLSACSQASLAYDQAAKFQTTLRDLCGPVVREAGKSEWTRLQVPAWCEAGSWTFAPSGAISLNDFAGKKIEVGFVYGSSPSGADTWEIKNFTVTGK